MKENVIKPVEDVPNEGVIALLEDLLENAKKGKIVGIAGVSMQINSEFGEFYSDSALDCCIPFLGYLRCLQVRFEREIEF